VRRIFGAKSDPVAGTYAFRGQSLSQAFRALAEHLETPANGPISRPMTCGFARSVTPDLLIEKRG
jgi:hypothetical protein